MKTIFKVKRKCSVPGCASVDCYAASRGSGGAVSLCRECAKELYLAHYGEKAPRTRKKEVKGD